MDLNQLKSFVAVAHQQNLTQAAETLHLSQPAVSAQIKALEKHLDVQLFERNAQGMSHRRRSIFVAPRRRHASTNAPTRCICGQHQARIPFTGRYWHHPNASPSLLAECVGLIKEHYPHIHQTFSLGLSGIILNQVRRKELHGGFFVGDNPYRNLHVVDLMPLQFEVVMPVIGKISLPAAQKRCKTCRGFRCRPFQP